MANSMMCSWRLASISISAGERWRGPIPRASNLLKPSSLALTVPLVPRNLALGFTICAASSDFSDPERILDDGDGYGSDSQYGYSGSVSGGSESEMEPFSEPSGSFSAKLDAASQLSESVPSSSVEQLEGDGGDRGNAGPRGGGRDGNNGDGDAGSDDQDGREDKKKLSASQKLTLAYALLVGVGGIMGYAKSKSVKSLASGAVSTAILYYVYKQLPTNPIFASSLGLGISVLLLALMGARFQKSGKLFPAGVVSLVSLIMTGGYIHGIIRSSHR